MMHDHAAGAEQHYIDSMLGCAPDATVPSVDARDKNSDSHCAVADTAADVRGNTEDIACMPPPISEADKAKAAAELENLYQVFMVAGIRLAVPVRDIERAQPGETALLDNNRLQTPEGQFHVIDMAPVIQSSGKSADIDHYIVLRDSDMAVACSQMLGLETISPDEICRRSENSQRFWLAGTVAGRGIAILDLDGVSRLAESQT